MVYQKRGLRNLISLGLLGLFLYLVGCANRLPPLCIKDGKEYCITDEWIFSEEWYSCYIRGISCTQGGCWGNALDEFLRAAQIRGADTRWVRTYGMHRLPEYFPNREVGIAYYHLGEIDSALVYLTLSLKQCESAKTKFYLNKARREKLILTQKDIAPPRLFLDPYREIVVDPAFILTGTATDDNFVADCLFQVNKGRLQSTIELSHPLSYTFKNRIQLSPGINSITIKVVDLLGKEAEKQISVLLDQEGPLIYFAASESGYLDSPLYIKGLLYDPSGVTQFFLNNKKIELLKEVTRPVSDTILSESVYFFHYPLSVKEQAEGIVHYYAEDSLGNITSGSMSFSNTDEQASEKIPKPVRMVMVAQKQTTDNADLQPYLVAENGGPDFMKITISNVPERTFEELICPRIEVLSKQWMRQITINGEPVLSIYGLQWNELLEQAIRRFFDYRGEQRLLFNRVITLKEGENSITIKIIDISGREWEKSIQVKRDIKRVHQLEERWRMAIPLLYSIKAGDNGGQNNKDITYQLTEAFVNQKRFKVIDLESLPIIIDERSLGYYLGRPRLGLSSESTIWIDIFLLGYLQLSHDSLTLSASLIDLETGEILATKDVCEEIGTSGLAWHEGLREHTLQTCSVLAAKFKEHFPLCDGNIISLMGEAVKTDICRKDGLKEGMKLLLFTGDLDRDEEVKLFGDAKVKEVKREYSMAELLEDLHGEGVFEQLEEWGVITR